MKDSQRTAVYRWESKVIAELAPAEAKREMSLDECVALVRRVWNDYRPGDEVPEVKDGRGRRRASGSRWTICLPKWARTQIVVLHEIAHSLQKQTPWHGPEFAMLMLELWEHYAKIPRTPAKRLGIYQKPRRVRFASPNAIPRKPRREWRKWKADLQDLFRQRKELNRLIDEHKNREPRKS